MATWVALGLRREVTTAKYIECMRVWIVKDGDIYGSVYQFSRGSGHSAGLVARCGGGGGLETRISVACNLR